MNLTFLDDLKEYEDNAIKGNRALYQYMKKHEKPKKKDKAGNILTSTSSNPKSGSKNDSSSLKESSYKTSSAGQKSNTTQKTKHSSTVK
jgi:hypothetical protein